MQSCLTVNIYLIRDRIAESGNPIVTNRLISIIAGVSVASSQVYLNRMLKAGMLTHVERGKYAMRADPYSVASNIVFPSYISFATALSINQLVDQAVDRILVVTSLKRREASFQEYPIRFVTMKQRLIFGYRKIMRGRISDLAGRMTISRKDWQEAMQHLATSELTTSKKLKKGL